jgi:spore coat protein CotH
MMSVDGNEQNMGIYLAVETISKGFIKRNFVKSARNGDLYKLSWGSGKGASFDDDSSGLMGVEELFKSDNGFWQKTYTYDLKTNKKTSDHSALKAFINASKTSTGATRKELMQEKSLYEEFIAFTASLYVIGDPDDLRANCNNAYIYFAVEDDNTKIVFIPIDHDRAFGSCGDGGNPTGNYTLEESPFSDHLGYGANGASDLFNKMIVSSNSKEIRADYVAKLEEIANSSWLQTNTFENLFNIVKEHYKNDLALGSLINNSKKEFLLTENSNIHGNDNLSIVTYLNTKRNYILAKNW